MERSVVIITGFMGSGKSVVAHALAQQLQCSTVDLDQLITETEGSTPTEIIKRDGEDRFRRCENRVLKEVLATGSAAVIALGGGTWTIPENRKLIEERNCLTVWLDAPFELCWKRILASGNERPLAPDELTARNLYERRKPIYALAQMHVPVADKQSVIEISAEIARALINPVPKA
jgi:shikimate kinase